MRVLHLNLQAAGNEGFETAMPNPRDTLPLTRPYKGIALDLSQAVPILDDQGIQIHESIVLVRVSIAAQNIMTKKQVGEERVSSAYTSTLLLITKGI